MPSSTPVRAALCERLPSANATDAEHLQGFRSCAQLLLNECTLRAAGVAYRIAEIELYWTSRAHPDPFTHLAPEQQEFGRWYFHRLGGAYKGGTYKGIDIAVGSAERHAGILLRAIEDTATDERIDGSCSVVDRLLAVTGSATVAALADSFDRSIDAGSTSTASSPLYLELAEPGEARPLIASARVGLTLKRGATPLRQAYLARHYRFLTDPPRARKGRPHIVIARHQAGDDVDTIHRTTGIGRAAILRYLNAYSTGLSRDPSRYARALNTAELCELFGSLQALKALPCPALP